MSQSVRDQLTSSDKDFLTCLLKMEKASMYTLAKNTDWSYAAIFASAKKLASLGLITKSQEEDASEKRRKIIYTLTELGREIALTVSTSLKASPQIETTESVPKPLGSVASDFVLLQKRETAELDFKLTLDIGKNSNFADIAKDIFAMSNYGGGYIAFGFLETPTGAFDPIGLSEDFHIDQATLQEKFNSYSNEPIEIGYEEVERSINGENRKFALIYVPPSKTVLKPTKAGVYPDQTGKLKKSFSEGDIFVRRGTQSIRADLKEVESIEKRAKETEYKISLLTGRPDKVSENLFGNFFKSLEIPQRVFEAVLPQNIQFKFFEIKETPFVRVGERIYSFCDVSAGLIGNYIQKDSFISHDVSYFIESQDRRNILIWLLNQEIKHEALKRGLKYDRYDKKAYFYPTDTPVRYETWEGRYKKSTRLVAKQNYIKQLNSVLFIHFSASISFGFIGDQIYLKVLPRIVLTTNGYDTVQSFREGAIKTRLTYNQYNYAYFNLVLFWVSRFLSNDKKRIEFGSRVFASRKPVTATLNVGIRSDRSTREFSHKKEDFLSFETIEEID